MSVAFFANVYYTLLLCFFSPQILTIEHYFSKNKNATNFNLFLFLLLGSEKFRNQYYYMITSDGLYLFAHVFCLIWFLLRSDAENNNI